MTWIDSHCHLDSLDDLAGSLKRASDRGVEAMVTVGTDLATSRQAVAHAEEHDHVWAVVGVHPYDAEDVDQDLIAKIGSLASSPRVVAIGEIGLDLHREHSPLDEQVAAFKAQLVLAEELGSPVVLHVRDAHEEVMGVLAEVSPTVPIVFHCFSGDEQIAERALGFGGYISFAGNISYKSAEQLRRAARVAPIDRLLVETDSPYLAPVPHRGKPNEPGHVADVGTALAHAIGLPVEAVAEATSANARRVFGHRVGFT